MGSWEEDVRQFMFDIIPTLTHRFIKLSNPNQTHAKILSNPRFMPFFQVSHICCLPLYHSKHTIPTILGSFLRAELHWRH